MDDFNSDSEIPSDEDFLPAPPRPLHPFDIWPSWRDGRIAIWFFVIVTIASMNQWQLFYFLKLPSLNLSASFQQVFINGEYWRLVTALFAHASFEHLMSNSLTLIMFSWILSAYFGVITFPVGGLLIGIASNAATLVYYGPGVSLVGASGMNYGLVALWLCLYIRYDRTGSFSLRIMRSIGFALLILFPQQYDPKVSYAAHLSGLLFGLLAGLICMRFLTPRFPPNSKNKRMEQAPTSLPH